MQLLRPDSVLSKQNMEELSTITGAQRCQTPMRPLPQEVWDWRQGITMPTLSENNFIVNNALLKRHSNIQTIKR